MKLTTKLFTIILSFIVIFTASCGTQPNNNTFSAKDDGLIPKGCLGPGGFPLGEFKVALSKSIINLSGETVDITVPPAYSQLGEQSVLTIDGTSYHQDVGTRSTLDQPCTYTYTWDGRNNGTYVSSGSYTVRYQYTSGISQPDLTSTIIVKNDLCSAGQESVNGSCQNSTKPEPPSVPSLPTYCDGTPINTTNLNSVMGSSDLGYSIAGFNTKSFSSQNIAQSISELIQKVNEVNLLDTKSKNLGDRGLTSKKLEVDAEKDIAETQRNNIRDEIISGLTSYKNSLRAKVNAIIGETVSSNIPKPVDLQGYKDTIVELDSDFYYNVTSENTSQLLYSLGIIADENGLLADLVNDFVSNSLADSLPVTNAEYPSEIDSYTKPEQVIRYLSNKIDYHKLKLNTEYLKLSNEINNLQYQIDTYNEVLLLADYYLNLQPPNNFSTNSYSANKFSIKVEVLTPEKVTKIEQKMQNNSKFSKATNLLFLNIIVWGHNIKEIYNNWPLAPESQAQAEANIRAAKKKLTELKKQGEQEKTKAQTKKKKCEEKKEKPPNNLNYRNHDCRKADELKNLKNLPCVPKDSSSNPNIVKVSGNADLGIPDFYTNTGSKKANCSDKDFRLDKVDPTNPLFACTDQERINDAENKAIQELDRLIKEYLKTHPLPTNPRPRIDIDSIGKPCFSCEPGLNNFAKEHPGIDIYFHWCHEKVGDGK